MKALPIVAWPVGTFVEAATDGSVRIDFGQGPVACLSAGFYEPLPGESVRVLQTTEASVMIGPARPRSVIGSVTATGTPYLTVDTSVGEQQLPYLTSYTPSTADLVLIFGNVVLGKVTAAPAGTYTPETPPVQEYSATFKAKDSGSYQGSSWWTDQVWCSDSNVGAWFYPDIADTIPDDAEITRVQVLVNEFYNQFPTSLATIGLHSLASKSGSPTVVSAVTVSAGSGWKTLPVAFGDALKTGTRKGLGTNHGGYHKFRSRTEDANSGALRIDWRV
jgi:hypothetical protein